MSGRVWLVLAGVAAGIGLQPTLGPRAVAAAVIAGAIAMALRRRPVLSLIATFALATCAGWWAAALQDADGAELRTAAQTFPRCRVEGRVMEQLGGLGTLIAVNAADCAASNRSTVIVSRDDLAAGTTIAATGLLRPLGDDGFERARKRAGADAELIPTSLNIGPVQGPAHRAADGFRSGLRDSTEHLSEERRGLILGMTIGDTSALPDGTNDQLQRSGLTHLLAVSGSNVAIVLGVVAVSLRRLSLNARVASSAAALAFYVLIVGPQPSVVRAGVMGAIALTAMWRGAPSESLNTLALALVTLLLVRPGLLLSPGLHLSAAATAGIVLWARRIADRCTQLPRPVALALGATLAAQFAVSPVLLATFGEMSLVAPVANVLAFPMVAPITVVGLAAGIVALVSDAAAATLMSSISPLAGWIVRVGEWTGSSDWAAPTTPRWLAWPAAALVVAVAYRTLRDNRAGAVAAPRDDGSMTDWTWRSTDRQGNEIRTSEAFASKEEAEAWMGQEWAALRDEGADAVTLFEGDTISYKMSLHEG